MKFWLNDDIDMTQIVDSMQLDSNQEIAGMEMGEVKASLEVRGEVRVWWNASGRDPFDGECYTRPSEFPQELKDLIKNDGWYDVVGGIYVSENNWFELFFAVGDTYEDSDVVDVERMSPAELFTLLYDTCVELKERR